MSGMSGMSGMSDTDVYVIAWTFTPVTDAVADGALAGTGQGTAKYAYETAKDQCNILDEKYGKRGYIHHPLALRPSTHI